MLGKFESYGIRGRDTEQKPVSEIKESLYPRGISEQRKWRNIFSCCLTMPFWYSKYFHINTFTLRTFWTQVLSEYLTTGIFSKGKRSPEHNSLSHLNSLINFMNREDKLLLIFSLLFLFHWNCLKIHSFSPDTVSNQWLTYQSLFSDVCLVLVFLFCFQ